MNMPPDEEEQAKMERARQIREEIEALKRGGKANDNPTPSIREQIEDAKAKLPKSEE